MGRGTQGNWGFLLGEPGIIKNNNFIFLLIKVFGTNYHTQRSIFPFFACQNFWSCGANYYPKSAASKSAPVKIWHGSLGNRFGRRAVEVGKLGNHWFGSHWPKAKLTNVKFQQLIKLWIFRQLYQLKNIWNASLRQHLSWVTLTPTQNHKKNKPQTLFTLNFIPYQSLEQQISLVQIYHLLYYYYYYITITKSPRIP